MNENQQKALQEFNEVSNDLKKSCDKMKGKSAKNGIERRYSKAYQNCVKAGIFSQIKEKYRSN